VERTVSKLVAIDKTVISEISLGQQPRRTLSYSSGCGHSDAPRRRHRETLRTTPVATVQEAHRSFRAEIQRKRILGFANKRFAANTRFLLTPKLEICTICNC
jgi:hypothetical protein